MINISIPLMYNIFIWIWLILQNFSYLAIGKTEALRIAFDAIITHTFDWCAYRWDDWFVSQADWRFIIRKLIVILANIRGWSTIKSFVWKYGSSIWAFLHSCGTNLAMWNRKETHNHIDILVNAADPSKNNQTTRTATHTAIYYYWNQWSAAQSCT